MPSVTRKTPSNKKGAAALPKKSKQAVLKKSGKAPAAPKAGKQTIARKPARQKAAVKTVPIKRAPVQSGRRVEQEKKGVKTVSGKDLMKSKKTATIKTAEPLTERFRGLRSMLVAKRDALLRDAKMEIQKYVSGENRQLVDTAIDEADWAAVEISEDINLKRLSAQRQLLNDVEECLRKVDEGSYGVCEDCGEEISEKRLRVIPTATLCIDCKEQREKMAFFDQESEL